MTSPTPPIAPKSPPCSAFPTDASRRRPSWSYDGILDGVRSGAIRGLWVVATNPAHSWIDQDGLRETLGKLDFLVVQDMYHSTETAALADLLLPAAGWGEKEGTFINSERRVGLIKKVRRAPGQALSDFHIFKLAAHYYGCGEMFAEWDSPESVFQILKRLSAGRPCDISGIADYRALDEARGVQWPYPLENPDPSPQRRLFGDGRFYHPDGRARFLFEEPRPLPEPMGTEFPFQLLTGRGSAAQWHTQTRTAKSDVLRKLHPRDPYVEINPATPQALGLTAGGWMVVESRRGTALARAFVTPTVPVGQIFLPMHDGSTNRLTLSAFDPESRQPAYKACAARVRAARAGEVLREADPHHPLTSTTRARLMIMNVQTRKTVVVVGNGMVGHRFCERLAALGWRPPFRDRDVLRGAQAGVRSRQLVEILRQTRRRAAAAGLSDVVRRERDYPPRGRPRGGHRPPAAGGRLGAGPRGRLRRRRPGDGLGAVRAGGAGRRQEGGVRLPDDRGPRGRSSPTPGRRVRRR